MKTKAKLTRTSFEDVEVNELEFIKELFHCARERMTNFRDAYIENGKWMLFHDDYHNGYESTLRTVTPEEEALYKAYQIVIDDINKMFWIK